PPDDVASADHGGQQPHAHVEGVAADVELDTAVLRQAALGDVQVGHHLDAAGDSHGQVPGWRHHLVQYAVAAIAHLVFFFKRLEMDVAGVVLNCQEHHHVEQLAHGGGVLDFHQAFQVD